jgi:catechol 2,3-dioxygenase-like lactoylglutathione lyase family enzyme
LLSVLPTLRVVDLDRSRVFYEALGFSVVWIHQLAEDQPRLAAVHRGTVQLFLTEHPVAPFGAVAYIETLGVDALASEAVGKGVNPTYGPSDQPWGTREVYFRDSDGNVLRFGEHRPTGS